MWQQTSKIQFWIASSWSRTHDIAGEAFTWWDRNKKEVWSCMLWGICPKTKFFLDNCGHQKALCCPHLSIKASITVWSLYCQVFEAMVMHHGSNTVWAASCGGKKQRLRREQAEKPEKRLKEGEERLRRWFSGCIWCCECSKKLRLTEQCLLCRPCDDMFNQERHVGLRMSSWSFQFFCPSRDWRVRCADYRLYLTSGVPKTMYFWKLEKCSYRVNRSNVTSQPYASSFSVLKSTLFLSQVTACSDLIFSRHRHLFIEINCGSFCCLINKD